MPFDFGEGHIRYTPFRRMLSRRDLFQRISVGLGGMALTNLLGQGLAATTGERRAAYDVLPKNPHFPPKARRVILLFQNGGPSQVDLFDPKQELTRRDGQKPGQGYVNDVDAKKTGTWLSSPFKFCLVGKICG